MLDGIPFTNRKKGPASLRLSTTPSSRYEDSRLDCLEPGAFQTLGVQARYEVHGWDVLTSLTLPLGKGEVEISNLWFQLDRTEKFWRRASQKGRAEVVETRNGVSVWDGPKGSRVHDKAKRRGITGKAISDALKRVREDWNTYASEAGIRRALTLKRVWEVAYGVDGEQHMCRVLHEMAELRYKLLCEVIEAEDTAAAFDRVAEHICPGLLTLVCNDGATAETIREQLALRDLLHTATPNGDEPPCMRTFKCGNCWIRLPYLQLERGKRPTRLPCPLHCDGFVVDSSDSVESYGVGVEPICELYNPSTEQLAELEDPVLQKLAADGFMVPRPWKDSPRNVKNNRRRGDW
jgi:hypothetical protein